MVRQGLADVLILGQGSAFFTEAPSHHRKHRSGNGKWDILGNAGGFQALLVPDIALVGEQVALDKLYKRGLAASVTSHQADFFAWFDLKGDVVQQCRAAKPQMNIFY